MGDGKTRLVSAGRIDQLSSGATRIIELEGCRVLLARWGGQVFAYAPVCPHRGNPLDAARVWQCEIECPWHHYRYDLRNGENVYPRNVYPLGADDIDQGRLQADLRPLRTYPAEIHDGEIFVELATSDA